MTSSTTSDAARPEHGSTVALPLALLALAQPLIFAIPIIVLGRAIGWPASLSSPAGVVLPAIHDNAGAVLLGYWSYLAVSLLMIPLVFAFRAWAGERGTGGWWLDALTFVGAAAAILKMLGIVRWLSVMPALAREHAAAGDATRSAIELTYRAMNAYAGSVGELLGVQLASGMWLVGAGIVLTSIGRGALGAGALLAGTLFVATCLRTAIPHAAALQGIAVPLALLWFAAFAWSLRRD